MPAGAKARKDRFAAAAEETAAAERAIQKEIDRKEKAHPKKVQKGKGAMQAGARPIPSRLPQAAPAKPGNEAELDPAPMYDAPYYKGSDKLQGQGRPDHRRRFRHRPRRGRAVRARRRRRRDRLSRRARGRRRDEARGGGRRAALPPHRGRRRRPGVLRSDAVAANGQGARQARRAGQQRRLPGARRRVRGSDRGALRPDAEDQSLRLFPHGQGGGAAHEARQRHRQHRLGDRASGQQGPARLFDDQGRHPRLHALARHASDRRAASA